MSFALTSITHAADRHGFDPAHPTTNTPARLRERWGVVVSRILASDWTKLAGIVIALATTLVMIGRWQGQTEGQLSAILARLTAIEAQGAGWHVLAQTSATHEYRLKAAEDAAERLEQRVRQLEQR